MLRITDEARDELPAVRVRWARIERVGDPTGELDLPARARERSLDDVKAADVVQAYRSWFWSFDVDPTKRRPASEALARRAAEDGLPAIHPLVDTYNGVSAATLVALSAFDADALAGDLRLDVPREDEALDAIGEAEPVDPTGQHPVWRDEEGLVGLAAYRDAQRTALSSDTSRAILLAIAPDEVPLERVKDAFAILGESLAEAGWRFTGEARSLQMG